MRENGAEAVFNHREKDYVQKIKEKYPNGFDIILEMLANQVWWSPARAPTPINKGT